jgi:IMP dehydrogenase
MSNLHETQNPKVLPDMGLTFDDVLIVPRYSEVLPKDVNTRTRLTKDLWINIPLISASMDTVTGPEMAIAMAQAGGIGIIHKNMTIEAQSKAVKMVKNKQISGIILKPLKCKTTDTISEVKKRMEEKSVHHFAVEDKDGNFAGLISHNDIGFFVEEEPEKLVSTVMTTDCVVIDADISFEEAKKRMKNGKIKWLPVLKNKVIYGLYTWKDIKNVKRHPNAARDEKGRLLCGAAVGVAGTTEERVDALVKAGVDVIVIDTAHGHSNGVAEQVKMVKAKYPNLQVIAGNVATAEGAKFLAEAGADAVKVGIGPGSICTTRIVAGIGVPQLTAIMEAVEGLKDLVGVPIIADGGIKYSGEVVKALVAGASSIMAGSLFAGTDESPGEPIIFEGRKVKSYRGMGSEDAMKAGSADRYLQDPEEEIKKLVPEGVVGEIPYKGSVHEVIYQLVGGLRAGMGYTGSENIEQLKTCNFRRITGAGLRESHPHDIRITKDEANYSK